MPKKLKSKKTYECECDAEGVITSQTLVNQTTYDKLGNSIREEVYENEEIAILVENTYEGALLQKTQQTDYVNQFQQNWEFLYDDKGRKIEQRELYEAGGYAAIRFEYNEEGKILTELFVDDEEEVSGKVQYNYDDKGNLLAKIEYDGNDFTTPWISTNYKYDDKNNVIQKNDNFSEEPPTTTLFEYNDKDELDYAKVFYTDNNALIIEQTTLEDDDGNIIGMEILDHKRNTKKENIVKKNDKDQMIEEEVFINDTLNSTTKINYNEKGDIIEEKNLSSVQNGYMQWSAKSFEIEYWNNEEEE